LNVASSQSGATIQAFEHRHDFVVSRILYGKNRNRSFQDTVCLVDPPRGLIDLLIILTRFLKLPLLAFAQPVDRVASGEITQRNARGRIVEELAIPLALVGWRTEKPRQPNSITLAVVGCQLK
jgi:hypothetical protein